METTNYKSDVWKMKVKHLCALFFFQIWSSGLIPMYALHQLLMI